MSHVFNSSDSSSPHFDAVHCKSRCIAERLCCAPLFQDCMNKSLKVITVAASILSKSKWRA